MNEGAAAPPEDPSSPPAASSGKRTPLTQRIVEVFLRGNLSVMLLAISLLAGVVALLVTPREEEPQIVVPLADVFVRVPGAGAEEVERQVATRLEKILYQIDGVEYVYSMSRPELAVVTVRFYVGENREASLVKIYNKINSNQDFVPPSVAGWVVKPVEIDDVPIVNVTLYSDRYDDDALRRLAEEIEIKLQSVKNTNKVSVIGGRPRSVRVELDPTLLAAHSLSPLEVVRALQVSNVRSSSGSFEMTNLEFLVDAGDFLGGAEAIRQLVVGVEDGKPVKLGEVADVLDGPVEVETYTRTGFGPAAGNLPAGLDRSRIDRGELLPAVHVAVAKKKGTNAVWVARAVEKRMEQLRRELFPDGVYYRITRNYGETADAKVNELVEGLMIALIVVIGLICLTMGWREALIIAAAVPVTFSLTLLVNYLFGYTINRVTLFALTLSLGLVVDDPIVDVENIYRHFKMRKEPPLRAVLTAVNEVRPPIILATLAVIVSFLPLNFITGMMGPYMAPMALNVPLAMLMSLVVAFTLTPWMSYHVLKSEYGKEEKPWELERSPIYRACNTVLPLFMKSRLACWALLAVTAGLFGFAGWLAMSRRVPLKMLPFDNKNEFQIVIDMPEGTPLEMTDAAANALVAYLRTVPEVTDLHTYVGTASAMDFNGMVRHYYLRRGSNVADVRVNLVAKDARKQQSHEIILRLRKDLTRIAAERGANVKMVEMPPGPPVIATITAEVRGRPDHSYDDLIRAAKAVRARLEQEAGVVDVDDTVESDQTKFVFVTDKEKAALNGVSTEDVTRTVRLALAGTEVGSLRRADEANPLAIEIRMPRGKRSSLSDLRRIGVKGGGGNLVTLGEIGHFQEVVQDKTIYHKNLERVVYVFAEAAGRPPAEIILDVQADRVGKAEPPSAPPDVPLPGGAPASDFVALAKAEQRTPPSERTYLRNGAGIPWTLPEGSDVKWSGEGEWDITLRVFRDLGLAFAAACVGIYLLLIFQTGSYLMPLILMISIPLTLIGIMPGFWLLSLLANENVGGFATPVFFTATAMIGVIALSGIAVRNAILLIEFVHEALKQGLTLRESLVRSGAVRLRPILLTAGAAGLAAFPITLDPIFSGLAWALIFGLTVSTAFTLLVIPVVYWLVYANRPGHGAPQEGLTE
jgi:multidrug efflux pump subunit AcrB